MARIATKKMPWETSLGWLIAGPMLLVNNPMEGHGVERLGEREGAVLVVGYGAGGGLRQLLLRSKDVTVHGIDMTPKMYSIAKVVNRRAVAEGRLMLEVGSIASAPWPEDHFDGALAVNNIHLWAPRGECLSSVHRMLRPSARFVAGSHRVVVDRSERIEPWLNALSEDLAIAGFHDIRTERVGTGLGEEVWVTAAKP